MINNPVENISVTLFGIIVPSGWDADGRVVALTLSTFEEDEYVIDQACAEQVAEGFVGRKVSVCGTLSGKTKQVLTIRSIEPF